MVDQVLKELSPEFDKMYSKIGRPSIAPEQLLRALLLQMLYSVRWERLLMEELDYNILFRWFGGLNLLKVDWIFTFACAAYNLVRMRNLMRRSAVQ